MKKIILFLILFFISLSLLSQNTIKYEVKSGDYLSKISEKYDIPVEDIKEFNGLTSNIIYIGQILEIPSEKFYEPVIRNDYDELDLELRSCIRDIYYSQIGVRELTGNNDGVYVKKYLNSAGLDEGYPWCAAYVYWVLKRCGLKPILKYPAWVPSYFPEDKLIYVRGKFKKRDPIYGDLIGIWFSSKNRLAHIGFYDGENEKYYFTVEGNTNEAGSREGDGVYRKRRIKRQVHSISSWVENKSRIKKECIKKRVR